MKVNRHEEKNAIFALIFYLIEFVSHRFENPCCISKYSDEHFRDKYYTIILRRHIYVG